MFASFPKYYDVYREENQLIGVQTTWLMLYIAFLQL